MVGNYCVASSDDPLQRLTASSEEIAEMERQGILVPKPTPSVEMRAVTVVVSQEDSYVLGEALFYAFGLRTTEGQLEKFRWAYHYFEELP